MPNIKSSIKSVKKDAARNLKNSIAKTKIKTATKKTIIAIKDENLDNAKEAYITATSVIDKAASKGVIHKNAAARKKSRLAKNLNTLSK